MSTATADRAAYAATCLAAGPCIHDEPGGDVVRPWVGTPACPFCRQRHRVHWQPVRPLPPPERPVIGSVLAHGVQVCQFGMVHARCRCDHDTRVSIVCDAPDRHAPFGKRRNVTRRA